MMSFGIFHKKISRFTFIGKQLENPPLLLSCSGSFSRRESSTCTKTRAVGSWLASLTRSVIDWNESGACTCWRRVVRTGSKHMPTEKSSQTAAPATRERCIQISTIRRRKQEVSKIYTWWLVGGSAGVSDSVKAAHPVFLGLHVQLITDARQRMDSFGQHYWVDARAQTGNNDSFVIIINGSSTIVFQWQKNPGLPFTFPPVTTHCISANELSPSS